MKRSAVILFGAGLVLAGCGGGGAKYRASVQDSTAIDPAELAVTIQVTNTGTGPGTPQCTIDANSPGYADTGVDVATLKDSLAAGQTTHFADTFTITNQGASNITNVTVKCS